MTPHDLLKSQNYEIQQIQTLHAPQKRWCSWFHKKGKEKKKLGEIK